MIMLRFRNLNILGAAYCMSSYHEMSLGVDWGERSLIFIQ